MNKYSFEGKIKDSPISKLIVTQTGYWPNQYKQIVNTLLVFFADRNYQGIKDAIWTGNNLVEADFMQQYLDANQ